MMMTRVLWAGLCCSLLCGCISNRIVNLTPRQMPRSPDNLYRIEAAWESNEQALRPETLQGYVVVDRQFHPMERTPNTVNRWEALVPVPPDQRFLNYRFKFNYMINTIPVPRPDSKLSPVYQLEIIDQ
ncbi:MAG: hypothetical protein D6766_02255 [Verrucomicrobia bacterium]|nr:MAG: hypothetical protein D6766_02255 [Verrucomicrobiota bacterium]